MAIARTRHEGLEAVHRLVEQFRARHEYYCSDQYDETTTRERWINPLFEALGWDVLDDEDRGEGRDVLYHVRIATEAGAAGEDEWDEDLPDEELAERRPRILIPDYSFRLGGAGRFFVEAKKPHRSLQSRSPVYHIPATRSSRYLTNSAFIQKQPCFSHSNRNNSRTGSLEARTSYSVDHLSVDL